MSKEQAGKARPTKKREREALLRMFMVTQEVAPEHFKNWTPAELAALVSKDAGAIGSVLMNRFVQAGFPVAEWFCIVHDKDAREVWSESMSMYVIEPKMIHFHFVARFHIFEAFKGATISQISSALGIEPQYVEKAKRGSNAWDNMVSYLIHAKYADKAQYSPDAVASGGLDDNGKPLWRPYKEIWAERRAEWEKGRAKITAQRAKEDADSLEEKILTGSVTLNQVLLTDSLYEIYARNKRRCDDAFAVWQARKIAKTCRALENGEFRMTVYFITGRSHAGKSHFTERLVHRLQADARERLGQEWTVCGVAANNPVDDYDGSEILVMDDLRGLSMTASDWLKLLDPDRANMLSARYKNKKVACRAIIINSEKDALDFFYFLKGSGGGDRAEAMDQFFRRLTAHVVVYRVPDDPDTRRAIVGEMRETLPYTVPSPSGVDRNGEQKTLTLAHDFAEGRQDMEYEDALDRLADIAMERNNAGGQAVKGQHAGPEGAGQPLTAEGVQAP